MPDAALASSEVVHRPDPGIARGVWEAPASAFYLALAVVLLVTLAYGATRLGVLKRRAVPAAGAGRPTRTGRP